MQTLRNKTAVLMAVFSDLSNKANPLGSQFKGSTAPSRTLKNLKKQAWKQKSYCEDNPEVVQHVNVLWHSLLTPLDQVILTETTSSSSSP